MKMKPWPICPECGAKRVAVCRFCKTQGNNFPPADMEYVLPPGESVPPPEKENAALEDADGRNVADTWDGTVTKTFIGGVLGTPYGETAKLHPACGCGHDHAASEKPAHEGCGCSRGGSLKLTDPLDETPEYDPDADEECPLMVMCPECGELIYPRFLNRCSKCDHEFQDGVEGRPDTEPENEEHSGRVLLAAMALAAVMALLAVMMMAK